MEDSGIESDPKPQPLIQEDKLFHSKLEFRSAMETDDNQYLISRRDNMASDSSNSSTNTVATPPKTNAKQLHRKLEMRIEQAKKIQRLQEYKTNNTSLIPIQRLPIPSKSASNTNNHREQQPLVDWETDDSDEEINFFPFSRAKETCKQELTDTFSIEDFEVSPDEDDLNLLTPKPTYHRCACCILPMDINSCSLM